MRYPGIEMVEFGEDGEEAVGGGDDGFEVVGAEDFLADGLGVLSGGDDGDAFPGASGGPGGDEPGERDDGEEVVEAGLEVGGEAEFEAAGVEVGLELEEVEEAVGWGGRSWLLVPGASFLGRRRFAWRGG
jgi:hypothetical protein